jgi:hypothetical protein
MTCLLPVIVSGQIRLRIYRGADLVFEEPLTIAQARLLATHLLDVALIGERHAAVRQPQGQKDTEAEL